VFTEYQAFPERPDNWGKSFRLIFLEGSIILGGKVQQQEKQHNHFIKLIGPNLYNTNILGTPKENLTGDSNP